MGLANRVVILTLARIANYGLMLVSPVVLVRLFSVEDFGRYREFLLYATFLQAIASFSIPESLLYFVPAHPASPWRVVKRTMLLTACSTSIVALVLLIANPVTRDALVGPYAWPLAGYVLFTVNLDFWECFCVARGRPFVVFTYSSGRLAARLIVVVVTALLTRNIWMIVWALVAVEGMRLLASAAVVRHAVSKAHEPPLTEPWRGFIRFCVPFGSAAVAALLSRTVSSFAVVKLLGAAALAQYAIGQFGEPIVLAIRNSISSVVLPEMVHRGRASRESPLALWQQATVVNAICLFPIAVLVARYAPALIERVFGAGYAQAAPVMQIFMIVVARECFDFGSALRAAGRTAPLVGSNTASFLTSAGLSLVLAPRYGITGAMSAYALASLVDATYLAVAARRTYGIALQRLLPWGSLAKVALACALASFTLFSVPLSGVPILLSVAAAGAAYLTAFALALCALRVPEAFVLLDWLKRMHHRRAIRGA